MNDFARFRRLIRKLRAGLARLAADIDALEAALCGTNVRSGAETLEERLARFESDMASLESDMDLSFKNTKGLNS